MSHDVNWENWRRRIQSARQRVDFARAFVDEVERDREAGAVSEHHGSEAYHRALGAEILALRDYATVLEGFQDLVRQEMVLDGKSSGPDRKRRPSAAENERGIA